MKRNKSERILMRKGRGSKNREKRGDNGRQESETKRREWSGLNSIGF